MKRNEATKKGQFNEDFIERLRCHPEFYERIDAILRIVEDTDGDVTKADEAEERVVQELRKLGQESLQSWANGKVHKVESHYEESSLYKRREKKSFTGGRGSGR
jgi:hypothetical protein